MTTQCWWTVDNRSISFQRWSNCRRWCS